MTRVCVWYKSVAIRTICMLLRLLRRILHVNARSHLQSRKEGLAAWKI